jgi:hypothetical protein
MIQAAGGRDLFKVFTKSFYSYLPPILMSIVFLTACGQAAQAPKAVAAQIPTSAVLDEKAAAQFLEKHWARPLAPQGQLSAKLAAQGISLAPESCASCHASQFEDWRQSLHSKAMGPGIMGQLVDMPAHARDDHQSCIRCHAPLAEQADSLVESITKIKQQRLPVASSDGLHSQGLVCAGCHVRNQEWHGPPRRDGSEPGAEAKNYPHDGWKANRAFESSQFCAACHQFKDDEYALNGKLLENTYQEWLDSRYPALGVSCQSCHMPDRRHLWKGIHDAETVKQGITIRTGDIAFSNNRITARLSIKNSGVGHYFPTYVTPKVVVHGFQQDAGGNKLAGTEQLFIIGRQVTLDLSREVADTRIAPDAEATFDYHVARQPSAIDLVWQVEVQADAFYLAFYEETLKYPANASARQLLTQARDHAKASPYIVFSRKLSLPGKKLSESL